MRQEDGSIVHATVQEDKDGSYFAAYKRFSTKEMAAVDRLLPSKDARTAYERQQDPNYNPGMSKEDAETIVSDVLADDSKSERFQKVSQALTQFNNDRLAMLVDAGVLTPSDRQRMLAAVDATTGDKEELRAAQSGLASGYLHAAALAVRLFEGPDAVPPYLKAHADRKHLTVHDGPSVAEAAAADRNWDVEQDGE